MSVDILKIYILALQVMNQNTTFYDQILGIYPEIIMGRISVVRTYLVALGEIYSRKGFIKT